MSQQAPLPFTRSGMLVMTAMGLKAWLMLTTIAVPVSLIQRVAFTPKALRQLNERNAKSGMFG